MIFRHNLCVFLFILCLQTATGQTVEEQKKFLTRASWLISGDKQSGVGNHKLMNEETKIRFFSNDSSWTCTDALEGEKTGTWWINEPGVLYIKPGKKGKILKCDMVISEDSFSFRYRMLTTSRILNWEPEEMNEPGE